MFIAILLIVLVLVGCVAALWFDVSRLAGEVDRLYDAVAGLTAAQMAADRELTDLRADVSAVRSHVARRGLDALDDRCPSLLD